MASNQRSGILIVINYYNARPPDEMLRLLHELRATTAYGAADISVVVNQGIPGTIDLPVHFKDVLVAYRDNVGMNIGAWDFAWRHFPGYDKYIFLQDECTIIRPDWLDVYARSLDDPRVGMVGEALKWTRPWPEMLSAKWKTASIVHKKLVARGVDPGFRGSHLQSLVWAMRANVLRDINGFETGRTKGDCIAIEVGVCRKVENAGLQLIQAGDTRFTYVSHPQWNRMKPVAASITPIQPHELG
jgi:hypothetical protein